MTKNKLLLLLALLMTAATGAWGMQIYISYPSWPTGTNVNGDGNLVLEMEASDSFENMKDKIGDKSGLNPDYMKLYFNSVEMANNETLNAKGVTSNSVLTLVYTLYTVSLKDGVKDADKWTVKVGEGEAQALPVGGLSKGDAVTLQYNGRLKVKGVKATSDAAPAEEPVPMEFVEFTNGTKKVKFANMNLGATSVADGTSSYGDYYAWAATEPFGTVSYTAYNAGTVTATKEGGYSAANAPYRSGNTYSKYTSHGAILEAMDDAATVKMGEGYRMPTMDDFNTLCAACGGTDAEIYISSIATGAAYAKGIYWVAGAETAVTVGGDEYKTNGVLFVQDADHHVFFPYAGRINGDNEFEYDGYYWSSTLITDTYSHDYLDAHYMYLCQYYVGHGDQYLTDRQLGFPIRPVQEVPAEATPALSITSPSVGQVIGSDGKNYAYGSLPTGVTAVAKICYVSGSNGLALALTDEGALDWSTANETCAAHTPAFTGGTWKLASLDEWNNMITTAGNQTDLRDGFSSVGGTNMEENCYWSSSEVDSESAWLYYFGNGQGYSIDDYKDVGYYVRACLAFTVEQSAKPAATVTTAPTGAAVVGVGKTTALVSGGVADGGTLWYAVTTTNTMPTSTAGFSDAVPTAQTITASGKVYVWYFVKGDDTHSDSEIAATAIEVPVADIVWDVTNVSDIEVFGTDPYLKEGVTLRGNVVQVQAMWSNGIIFSANASGGFTFTAPTGKAFTKIEMNAEGSYDWNAANLGTGWAYFEDEMNNIYKVTWTGSAAASTVELLKGTDYFEGAPVKSIAFTVEQAAPAANIVDLATLTADYEAQNCDVLTGKLGKKVKISIADGATVTLDNATIKVSNSYDDSYSWAGLNCLGNATIVLKDGTTNTVRGFYENYPGIHVPAGSKLTIQGGTEGTGKLTASPFDGGGTEDSYGAGIGGGYQIACGDIDIQGGIITATGGMYAAGIGGGYATCGNISITGGTVTAMGGRQGAGIGSGDHNTCGNITIASTVKKVTATAGEYAPHSIGKGTDGSCGTVTIGGTVYWQDNAALNDGDTYLATSPLIYAEP